MSAARPALVSLWLAGATGPPASALSPESARPDAVILDLPGLRAGGIEADALADRVAWGRAQASRRWVVAQLSPLASALVEGELDALGPALPDAVLLPSCDDGRDIRHCGVKLGVREARAGRAAGATAIIAMPSLRGLAAPAGFAGAGARLTGLAWDPAEAEAALGTAPGLLAAGGEVAAATPLRMLLLLAARIAGVAAYEVATAGPADASTCRAARPMGFDGRITRDARQIAAIAAAFGPPAVSAGA